MSEPTPEWALPLFVAIERIEGKLDNLKEWSERNVLDHEKRIRQTENTLAKMTDVITRLTDLEERQAQVEKRIWLAIGGLTIVGAIVGLISFNINVN